MSTAPDDQADHSIGRPDMDELEQDPYVHPAVAVRAVGPVAVQQLPTIAAQARNLAVSSQVVKALNSDPRRSRIVFLADGGNVYVGTDRDALSNGGGFLLPPGIPLVVTSTEQWFAVAETDATLSVINEQWAE